MEVENLESTEQLVIKGIRIDPSVLETLPIQRCEVAECEAACCAGGVWLNPDEMPRILEWAHVIRQYLPTERQDPSKWFETGDPDSRYAGGYEFGTTTVEEPESAGQTCCVFLRPDRVCALQFVSEKHNQGWPGLKPFYCALYPLYFEDGLLCIDDETPLEFTGGDCRRGGQTARPIYEIYREETTLVLGDDGYQALCEKTGNRQATGASVIKCGHPVEIRNSADLRGRAVSVVGERKTIAFSAEPNGV